MDGLKYQIWYKVNILYTGTNPDFKRRHGGGQVQYVVEVSEGSAGRKERALPDSTKHDGGRKEGRSERRQGEDDDENVWRKQSLYFDLRLSRT